MNIKPTDAAPAAHCYDLTPAELVNSPLAEACRKAGYASLKSALNDLSMWSLTVEETTAFFNNQPKDQCVPGASVPYNGMHIIRADDGLVYYSPAHQSRGFRGQEIIAMLASHAELVAIAREYVLLLEIKAKSEGSMSTRDWDGLTQARAALAKAKL
jgi:hypothetical protein